MINNLILNKVKSKNKKIAIHFLDNFYKKYFLYYFLKKSKNFNKLFYIFFNINYILFN